MALYLGNDKVRININGKPFKLYIGSPLIANAKLYSADNFVLKDANGVFLTVNKFEKATLLAADNSVLIDNSGAILVVDKRIE